MEFYRHFIWGLLAFIIGVFAFSNIFLTIFYTLPRIKRETKMSNLIKAIPKSSIAIPIIFWTLIILSGTMLVVKYYPDLLAQVLIGLVLAALSLATRIGRKNADMDEDFNVRYNEYLKNK